jgi:hypothetical protein
MVLRGRPRDSDDGEEDQSEHDRNRDPKTHEIFLPERRELRW